MFNSNIEVIVALAEARIVLAAVKGGLVDFPGTLRPDTVADIIVTLDKMESAIQAIGMRELKFAVNEYAEAFETFEAEGELP